MYDFYQFVMPGLSSQAPIALKLLPLRVSWPERWQAVFASWRSLSGSCCRPRSAAFAARPAGFQHTVDDDLEAGLRASWQSMTRSGYSSSSLGRLIISPPPNACRRVRDARNRANVIFDPSILPRRRRFCSAAHNCVRSLLTPSAGRDRWISDHVSLLRAKMDAESDDLVISESAPKQSFRAQRPARQRSITNDVRSGKFRREQF